MARVDMAAPQVGVLPPPEGVVPSFDAPESNAKMVVVSSVACLAVATLALCMRVYTRVAITKKFEMTDYTFVAAWGCSCILSALSIAACYVAGLGNHLWDIPLQKFAMFLKIKTLTSAVYCLGVMLIKLSLLLFYLQLAVDAKFRLVVCALIWIVASYSIASVVVVIFSCYPVSKSWDPTVQGGSCVNLPVFYIANMSLNSATDIAVLFLPAPLLWGLRMPLRDKIALSGVFMTGLGICVVSILRIRALIILLRTTDVTWGLVEGYVWSLIELNTAIFCAALLFIKPLLRKICSGLLDSTSAFRSSSRRQGLDPSPLSGPDPEAAIDARKQRTWKDISWVMMGPVTNVTASESQEQITRSSIP